MNYPLISEYVEAILAVEKSFNQLINLRPELDENGEPVMRKGQSSIVFKMRDVQTEKLYAIKCFLKDQEGRPEAYKLISEEISNIKSKISDSEFPQYLVNVNYLEEELVVNSSCSNHTDFPVLVMDWIEGETMDQYIKKTVLSKNFNKFRIQELKQVAIQFLEFAQWMAQQEIAHGDINPQNIIITENDKLVLVDYDGMFVPKMNGQEPRENGSPYYRHPNKPTCVFDSSIDDFSLCVIAFSLAAIAIDKDVYNTEFEDALVLSDKDLREFNSPNVINRINVVLHDKICSSLFSSILMQIANPYAQIDLDTLFSIRSYLNNRPPIFLPYKVGNNAFLIYDTLKGECISNHIFSDVLLVNDDPEETTLIVSYGGEIDYSTLNDSGNGFIRVTDLIIYEQNQKRPKAEHFALVSQSSDFNHLKWYNYIKPLTAAIFLVKNNDGKYGVISKDKILIPLIYDSIQPLATDISGLFLISKNEKNEYGLFKVNEKNEIVNIIKVQYDSKHWHYKNGASAPQNLIIFDDGYWRGYDLERGCFITLPPRLKRIKSYSEQILGVETWDYEDGMKLYNVDSESFINDDLYKTIGYNQNDLSPFNNGLAICETQNHKNVLVFKDGTSYIIPFEESRMRCSYNGKYVFYSEEIVEESNHDTRGYDIKFTIFDYRTKKLNSFIYHWGAHGIRANSVKDDMYVEISSHNMKYNFTSRITVLDLEGNPIDYSSIKKEREHNTSEEPPSHLLNSFDEEVLLNRYILSRFVNKKCIPNIDQYYEGVRCDAKNGYAVIRGVIDVDPEFGVHSELIGYADAERCYWKS